VAIAASMSRTPNVGVMFPDVSELRVAPGGVPPRALALALQELERARLVRRDAHADWASII